MSDNFAASSHKLADIDRTFEAYTPRTAHGKHDKRIVFNVSSGDSTEAIPSDDARVSFLSEKLDGFNPNSQHTSSVLCKPGSKTCILVDEVDEECASLKNIPRRFTRGRSGSGAFEADGGEQEHRARRRSTSRFRGYGKEEEDKIIRRARARSVSRGIRLSWNVLTNEEYSELSSTELAKRICPQSFHRFRRVGPNDKENDAQNLNKEGTSTDAFNTDEGTTLDALRRKSKSDFDVKFRSEVDRVEGINFDETGGDDELSVSKEFKKQRKSKSVVL